MLSASCAFTASAMEDWRSTSPGDADTPPTKGHVLSMPFTRRLPTFMGSWQSSSTVTDVVACDITLNGAEPEHGSEPSVGVAVSAIVYPLPGGRLPMTAPIVLE